MQHIALGDRHAQAYMDHVKVQSQPGDVIPTLNVCRMVHPVQEPDVDVIAKLLDEAMVPTAEYVANLESAVASAAQELAAFREDAAARREAESKV